MSGNLQNRCINFRGFSLRFFYYCVVILDGGVGYETGKCIGYNFSKRGE